MAPVALADQSQGLGILEMSRKFSRKFWQRPSEDSRAHSTMCPDLNGPFSHEPSVPLEPKAGLGWICADSERAGREMEQTPDPTSMLTVVVVLSRLWSEYLL